MGKDTVFDIEPPVLRSEHKRLAGLERDETCAATVDHVVE
jgi:hypothetical protein